MKRITLEQELLGTTKRQQKNEAFIKATMAAIGKSEAAGTFERVLRKTNTTNKEIFIMKLKRLPRLALIGMAAVGVTAMSGTAYAAYRLWANPSAHVDGNLVQLRDCRNVGDKNLYHIDARAGLSADDTGQVLRAHCEISNIQQWTMQSLHAQPSDIAFPYTIAAVHEDTLELKGDGQDARTISLNKATQYVVDGGLVDQDRLKVGDVIAYVATADNGAVKAAVKLSAAAMYYATSMQNHVIAHNACAGNPGDLCMYGGGISSIRIDQGGERTSHASADWDTKVIEGKLVGYTDISVTLQGSSGARYVVHVTSNLIERFNAASSGQNSGMKIALGDTLSVQYRQPKSADGHIIAADEFEYMGLVVTGDAKADSLKKY